MHKPTIKILSPGKYSVTSDTGHTYPVVSGACRCRGFHKHGYCKHLRGIQQFEAAISKARELADEKARRQRRNALMFAYFYG